MLIGGYKTLLLGGGAFRILVNEVEVAGINNRYLFYAEKSVPLEIHFKMF